jgi:outer membrane protein assembly factor BamD
MSRRFTVLSLLIIALGLTALAGCGGSNSQVSGTYAKASSLRESGKHRRAVEAYSLFLRRSPTDSLAALAQFEKALSYIEIKEYPLAVVEFQILRQEYPTNELVEEAFFREGEALLMQVNGIEKDITAAHEAREHFLSFLQTYPASPFGNEARTMLTDISDMVVRKHLRSARFYRRMKKFEASAIVLDRLLETERRSGLVAEVLLERADIARKMEVPEDEKGFLEQIVNDHAESPEAEKARKRLKSFSVDEEA